MVHTTAHQEPYTKYPNRYNDVIKPQLTDTQRDICDVVIRMTYGWHQTSAEISNSTFAAKTGKTVQAIIKAKAQLEEMGLLVVLERGGGSRAGVYMLDLYYDDPEKSVESSTIRQSEQLQELENGSPSEQEDIPELLENSAAEEPAVTEELQPAESGPSAESVEKDLPYEEAASATEEPAVTEEPQLEPEDTSVEPVALFGDLLDTFVNPDVRMMHLGFGPASSQLPRLDEITKCCPRNSHNLSDGRYAHFFIQQ